VKAFDWAGLLRRHPLLSGLDDRHLSWLVSDEVSTERTYEPGSVIFREGDEGGDSIFLIGSGSVEAVLGDGRGQTILLSLMRSGEIFGEMAFFEGLPRSATVRARDACVVLEIEGQPLRRIADAQPDLEFNVLLTVSERLRSKNEQILALHLKAVESANRAKDEFVAMLGHELRNPLGVISTAIRVLNTYDADKRTARLREIISRQTQHLSRLVDDLLDVSRLVSGKLTLERRPENLRELAERTLASFRELGRAKYHVISVRGEPSWVNVDPTRLEQVVGNLLDNAVKYSPPGGRIEVSIASEGGHAILSVRDDGVGIAPDALASVFDPFEQGKRASSGRSEGGLGLGLTLVKRLVELHGGTVTASSPGRNRGSEFVVRLPLAPQSLVASGPDRARPASQRPRQVLIVDDHPDFRDVLRMLLEAWGHQVEEADTGKRGLEMLEHSHPDVVLLDIGLPDLDGCTVARAVRSSRGGDDCTLVAITGYGAVADRHRTSEAGFDAHLTKPFDEDELARIVAEGRNRPHG